MRSYHLAGGRGYSNVGELFRVADHMARRPVPRYGVVLMFICRLGHMACASALLLALSAVPAAADSPDKGSSSAPHSYTSVSFLGGLLRPLRRMRSSHDQSLLAGVRVGWTSRLGLGIEVTADYSPLPRDDVPQLSAYETHFGVLAANPRFTLHWKKLRLWVGAGGGVAIERTTELYRDSEVGTRTHWSPAAVAAAGFEIHMLASGGLTLVGSYARLFRELDIEGVKYEYANLTGGLVFVF